MNIKLQIWDTAGQERFQTITTSYYHNANGIAVVYDVTNRDSFDSVSRWFHDIEKFASPNACKLLIGNKSDLISQRVVSEQEGIDLATSYGIPFIETSAKTANNVDSLFITLAKFIKENLYGKNFSSTEANTIKLQNGREVSSSSSEWCKC